MAASKARVAGAARLVLLLALAAAPVEAARAQNFFEMLFGIRRPPPPPPMPPASVGRPPPPPAEYPPSAHGGPPEAPGGYQPSGPPPPRPVVLKVPTEEGVLGRELKLNGSAGSLKLERARTDLTARLTLAGTKISQPTEACTVKLGDGEAIPLASQGRAEGVPRYEAQAAAACPIRFDILDGAVLVTAPAEACTFEAADCKAAPRGLWGPDPAALLPKASEIEQARGSADKAVRDNYRALTQAKPQELRAIVAEQAAFSSDREMLCRTYAREPAHGFCNARFSEARALSLANRLGVLSSPQAAAPRRRGATQIMTDP